MERKYNIIISSTKGAPQLADNVSLNFCCSISDPSIWVSQGVTTEKGLSFLDNDGQPLKSDTFKNQAYFNSGNELSESETEAIRLFIYSVLYEHYRFEKADIDVLVTPI
ncbi:MAG: hypothetical protein EOO02_18910 [Chitinophagaceae bacterium]|nr:MAG: hypothetical protein EOO02_18910 [Chitinophagaceae bacterium]